MLKVIAIGVPTVVDLKATMVKFKFSYKERSLKELMMVMPKNVDEVRQSCKERYSRSNKCKCISNVN